MVTAETITPERLVDPHYTRELGSAALHEGLPALTVEPARENYKTSPVEEAFWWVDIVDEALARKDLDASQPLFLVVFTSKQRADASSEAIAKLHDLDDRAHKVARKSPSLEHYYADSVDEHRRARSFCLWSDPDAARIISQDPSHKEAMAMISEYETYEATRYLLFRTADGVVFHNLQTGEFTLSTATSEPQPPAVP